MTIEAKIPAWLRDLMIPSAAFEGPDSGKVLVDVAANREGFFNVVLGIFPRSPEEAAELMNLLRELKYDLEDEDVEMDGPNFRGADDPDAEDVWIEIEVMGEPAVVRLALTLAVGLLAARGFEFVRWE